MADKKDTTTTAADDRDVADRLLDWDSLSVKRCKASMAEATEEYRFLRDDQSSAAMSRRHELARSLRSGSDYLKSKERIVEVTVPASATNEPFKINETVYWPGVHRVPASVAQCLLWMVDQNRQNEINLLKQNQRNFDLGAIGQKARFAEMQRDD